MSFVDLVSRRPSDLQLPIDVSPSGKMAKGILTAAGVTALNAVAVALNPSMLSFAATHGAYQTLGALKGGAAERDEAIAINEQNRLIRIRTGLRYLERVKAKNKASSNLLQKISCAYFALGESRTAIKIALEAIEIGPQDAQAYLLASWLQVQRKSFDEALRTLESGVNSIPSNYELLEALANVYEQTNNSEKAFETWKAASTINQLKLEPWVKLAFHYKSKKDFIEACRCFKAAAQIEPSTTLPWITSYEEGERLLTSGSTLMAQEAFKRANQYEPMWAKPILKMGRCEFISGQLSKANELMEQALRLDSKDYEIYTLAGDIYEKTNDLERAKTNWIKAYLLNSSARVPWIIALENGNAALSAEKFEQAIEWFDKALDFFGTADEALKRKQEAVRQKQSAHDRLMARKAEADGNDAASNDDWSRAEIHWNEALALDDSLSSTHMIVGALLADRGETQEALRHFERAATLGHSLGTEALSLCSAYHNFDPSKGPGN